MAIYSVREAAQKLGISERRVRILLAEGRIKGRQLDHTWVVTSLSYVRQRAWGKNRPVGIVRPQTEGK